MPAFGTADAVVVIRWHDGPAALHSDSFELAVDADPEVKSGAFRLLDHQSPGADAANLPGLAELF
jgi:hypothetical protein